MGIQESLLVRQKDVGSSVWYWKSYPSSTDEALCALQITNMMFKNQKVVSPIMLPCKGILGVLYFNTLSPMEYKNIDEIEIIKKNYISQCVSEVLICNSAYLLSGG